MLQNTCCNIVKIEYLYCKYSNYAYVCIMSEGKAKRGQPRKEETDTLCFRVTKKKKEDLLREFKGELNKMFGEWTDKLLEK